MPCLHSKRFHMAYQIGCDVCCCVAYYNALDQELIFAAIEVARPLALTLHRDCVIGRKYRTCQHIETSVVQSKPQACLLVLLSKVSPTLHVNSLACLHIASIWPYAVLLRSCSLHLESSCASSFVGKVHSSTDLLLKLNCAAHTSNTAKNQQSSIPRSEVSSPGKRTCRPRFVTRPLEAQPLAPSPTLPLIESISVGVSRCGLSPEYD